ncbi:hypothetical protein DLR67_02090 [Vibrio paracholerae]|nr:hypothetical protein DLR67_02090 [Vibrio paracholerae]
MLILSTVALSKFANYPPALIRKEFNVEVERTVRELNGQKCKGWDTARADKKQIAYFGDCDRSFRFIPIT